MKQIGLEIDGDKIVGMSYALTCMLCSGELAYRVQRMATKNGVDVLSVNKPEIVCKSCGARHNISMEADELGVKVGINLGGF